MRRKIKSNWDIIEKDWNSGISKKEIMKKNNIIPSIFKYIAKKLKFKKRLCGCNCGNFTNYGCEYIKGHHNKGKPLSQKTKDKISETKETICIHGIFPKGNCKICTNKYNRENHRKWVINNTNKIRKYNKRYIKNHPDKISEYRNIRRESVSNFTLIPVSAFPPEFKWVAHHLNYVFVVAMLKEKHIKCYAGTNTKLHRKKCLSFLNNIYEMNFIKDLI